MSYSVPAAIAALNPIFFADIPQNTTPNNSLMSAINDLSGNGNNATGYVGLMQIGQRNQNQNAWWVTTSVNDAYINIPVAIGTQAFSVYVAMSYYPAGLNTDNIIVDLGAGAGGFTQKLYINVFQLYTFDSNGSVTTNLGAPTSPGGVVNVFGWRGNASNTKCTVNGVAQANLAPAFANRTTSNIWVGSNSIENFDGCWVYRIVVFNSYLSDANDAIVAQALLNDITTVWGNTQPPVIFGSGNSIMAGYGLTYRTQNFFDIATSGFNPNQCLNTAIESMTTPQLTTNIPVTEDKYFNGNNPLPIMVHWEGTNDIVLGSNSQATAFANTQTYFATIRSTFTNANLITIGGTLIKRGGTSYTTYNTDMLANMIAHPTIANVYIPGNGVTVGNSAGQAVANYVIDWYTIAQVFQADNIHPTAATQLLMSVPLKALLESLVATTITGISNVTGLQSVTM